MTDKLIAIIPAAGLGTRFGPGANKSFVLLSGKPLLLWAIEEIGKLPEIAEIIPVLKKADMEHALKIFEERKTPKVKRVAPGGRERQDSVFNGLKLIEDTECTILVHDGARPLIHAAYITAAVRLLSDCDGVVLGVPAKDTIKQVNGDFVEKTLKREALWSVQTPQIFRYNVIFGAYRKAMDESFYSTDDSALVERYGGRIRVSRGSYENIKVTTPEDLIIAEAILKRRLEGR